MRKHKPNHKDFMKYLYVRNIVSLYCSFNTVEEMSQFTSTLFVKLMKNGVASIPAYMNKSHKVICLCK